jgi:hypothetical protein
MDGVVSLMVVACANALFACRALLGSFGARSHHHIARAASSTAEPSPAAMAMIATVESSSEPTTVVFSARPQIRGASGLGLVLNGVLSPGLPAVESVGWSGAYTSQKHA